MLRRLLISGLGTGYLPLAPGTWASAGAAGVFLLAAWASGGRCWCVPAVLAGMAALCSAGCLALGGAAEAIYGRKDPSRCTLDEWAGQAVTYLFVPLGTGRIDLLLAAGIGFLAFRFFDIVKPPPARASQRLPRGWGILTDDLLAGAYANLLCQVIFRVALRW